jgi:RNA polymerase sigma-70 factor (ECF subfamily)
MTPDLEQAALAGDERAWNALIRQHDRRVFVSLLAKGVPPAMAREIVQETWIRLVEQQRSGKLAELRLPGLAVVQAGFLWRSQRRRKGVPTISDAEDEERPLQVPDDKVSPEQTVVDREQLGRALDALDQCSDRQRQIFLAVQREGLTAAEASSRFGISVQRARQTLWEVRKRLRTALEAA